MNGQTPTVSLAELGAIVAVVALTTLAAVLVKGETAVILAGGAATLTGLLSFLRNIRTESKVDQTAGQVQSLEVKVDGRLTELLERTAAAERGAGRDEQREAGEQMARDLLAGKE